MLEVVRSAAPEVVKSVTLKVERSAVAEVVRSVSQQGLKADTTKRG